MSKYKKSTVLLRALIALPKTNTEKIVKKSPETSENVFALIPEMEKMRLSPAPKKSLGFDINFVSLTTKYIYGVCIEIGGEKRIICPYTMGIYDVCVLTQEEIENQCGTELMIAGEESYDWSSSVSCRISGFSKVWNWCKLDPNDYGDRLVFLKYDKIYEQIEKRRVYEVENDEVVLNGTMTVNNVSDVYTPVIFFTTNKIGLKTGQIVLTYETDRRRTRKVVGMVSGTCFNRNNLITSIIPMTNFMNRDVNVEVLYGVFTPTDDDLLKTTFFKHSTYLQFHASYGSVQENDILVKINTNDINDMNFYNNFTQVSLSFETFLMYNIDKNIMITVGRNMGKDKGYEFITMHVDVNIFTSEFTNKITFEPETDIKEKRQFAFSYDLSELAIERGDMDDDMFSFLEDPKMKMNNFNMFTPV
jgi:hypothetical protein